MVNVNGRVELVEKWQIWLELRLESELETAVEAAVGEELRWEHLAPSEERGASKRRSELAEAQSLRHLSWLNQQRGKFYGGHPRRSRRDRRQYDRAWV